MSDLDTCFDVFTRCGRSGKNSADDVMPLELPDVGIRGIIRDVITNRVDVTSDEIFVWLCAVGDVDLIVKDSVTGSDDGKKSTADDLFTEGVICPKLTEDNCSIEGFL